MRFGVQTIQQYYYCKNSSTMQQIQRTTQGGQSYVKFGKSQSLSSVRTEAQFFVEKEHFARKISEQQKQRLINLITVQNYNMKEASKIVKISYSTAKKIFTRFRKTLRTKTLARLCEDRTGTICSYRQVEPQNQQLIPRVKLISTIAGSQQLKTQNIILIGRTDC